MFDSKFFEDIAKKLSDVLPDNVHGMKKDLQKNFHSILQGAFSKLDLVTREEFDVQVKVLRKTRLKLEDLIEQVEELEKKKAKKKSE